MNRLVQRGFTLIEVMVVVAIVAILASVALPAYTDYIRRGQLPEAFTFLSDYRVKMEQYYQDNRNYGTAICADAPGTGAWNNFVPNGRKNFEFSCTRDNNGQGYTLYARGSSGRAQGYDYTVNQAGAKATIKFAGATVAYTCWASKAGDC